MTSHFFFSLSYLRTQIQNTYLCMHLVVDTYLVCCFVLWRVLVCIMFHIDIRSTTLSNPSLHFKFVSLKIGSGNEVEEEKRGQIIENFVHTSKVIILHQNMNSNQKLYENKKFKSQKFSF